LARLGEDCCGLVRSCKNWQGVVRQVRKIFNPKQGDVMKTETKDQLRAKIEDLEKRNEVWAIAHERIRQSLIEANHQLHACQVADPDFADKYQVVDPENAYWIENAEALIEISTGCLYEVDNVRKRVCTIPIPILQGNWRWDQEKETREENNARREKMLSESFGKVYQLARSITELYSKVGGWPDDEVIVDVRFQNIEGM